MPKITRGSAHGDVGPVGQRLARWLDGASLTRVVPQLPPEALHRIIRHSGLEACGALVASATPAQLTAVLDLDLWRPAAGSRDDRFDVDRFGEWLDALGDTSPSVAARTVAALDTDLVVAGLSRFIRVFDPGIFEPTAQSDDEQPVRYDAMREGDALPNDEARGDGLECEISGYIVRARRPDAWDAIVALLTTLADEHGDCLQAVMTGCRRLSNSSTEIDGLDDLLPPHEQQIHDVATARERRHASAGYATPAEARAFLALARRSAHGPSTATGPLASNRNPVAAAYFRDAEDAPEELEVSTPSPVRALRASAPTPSASRSTDDSGGDGGDSRAFTAAIELLAEAGLMPERRRALPGGRSADSQPAGLSHLRELMAYVSDTDETAYLALTRELAFLGNVLLSACTIQGRPLTPQEASEAAASICNLGLESSSDVPSESRSASLRPGARSLVTMFEVGWSVLHRDVSLFVAQELISILGGLRCVDRDIRLGLVTFRRELVKHCDAGTPWRARRAADVLAMLDTLAWVSVLGLLDECPVVPAALSAVVEGRTARVSPAEFAFISTAAQIGDVRVFMRTLQHLLE